MSETKKIVKDPNMLLILDKINNKMYEIDRNEEVIIDPAGNPIILSDYIDEYRDENLIITGIIFKEDGSSMILYRDIIEVYEEFANEYKWISFNPKTCQARYDHAIAADRMDELALKFKDKTITEKENREFNRIINFLTKHGYDKEH
jgi:hypothetical protein